jgi:aspartyl-tRNA(Asn)/glutamyl-tRNA(Gln) amidotransferase subunit C
MINKEEVRHISGLARIGMDDNDLEKFSAELSGVLDWIEQLKELDVDEVVPTAHITGMHNITREDKSETFSNRDGIIAGFPEEKDGYDKVKSVL